MKIQDSVVLVTGANRGLGRALVEGAIAKGARKVYAGARDPDRLASLVEAHPGVVIPLAIDITSEASLAAAAKAAPDVGLLVNNAGVLASFGTLTSSAASIAKDFETNFFGTLAATKAFLPALEHASGGAAILNILSIVSFAAMPALGTYSASKAAALSVTQALRADLAPKGIRVHAAFPGPIDTDMIKDFAMQKTSPADVAGAILRGVEDGLDDIVPDATAREMYAAYKRDPKELEKMLASMSG